MYRTYPYCGLRECCHREVCYDSLEEVKWDNTAARLEKPAHEVVEASLQTEEEIGICRLGDIPNRAVGQNQVVADNGIDDETVLVSLVGITCWCHISKQKGRGTSGNQPPPSANPPTPTCYAIRIRIFLQRESQHSLTPLTRPPRTETLKDWSRSYTVSQIRPVPTTAVPDAAS